MPVSDYEYQPLATDDEEKPQPRSQRQEPTSDVRELHRRLEEDPRFNPPTPAAWKRVLLIIAMLVLLWIGIRLRMNAIPQEPQVVHANRYSKDYKFRPAASPVITEKLKDGRTRLRGAIPTAYR